MTESVLIAGRGTNRITREELALIPAPTATLTHQPIAHIKIVEALMETLAFRHINVAGDEYAVSQDGMKMFGLMELDYDFTGCRFAIGIRNANDKSMRLALTVGYRVFVCSNMAFKGDFSPVLSKHSKNFNLIDALSVGVDRIQRSFEPLQKTINQWREYELQEAQAKGIIYDVFVDHLAPLKLLPSVHQHYFEPEYDEFQDRSMWSLSNAFTSSFKALPPFQQFKATGKLNPVLNKYIDI
jgi:hypothetical protein